MHSVYPKHVLATRDNVSICAESVDYRVVEGDAGDFGRLRRKVLGEMLEGVERGRGGCYELDGLVSQLC